ncbi:LysR family transcriptional regulator [Bartonella sp. HY406]|uniref:LysR family transcriptional regulator n=1 Tax=Bartonella sp. HY406 TaxID=2979331 RepID=UPI0021C65AB9|nr:LysR family transcriptional regulator [Bartonella sp. HY406]UXN02736.1 LysR family transcriptional regulator [Bartonella sp. HY406]
MGLLTRMRSFIAVVEAEGFSAAGRKSGRSKALLSKQVRELEDMLGVLLLNRTTRQLSLTEAGQLYYLRAHDIVREIEDLGNSVAEATAIVQGKIKLSAPHPFAASPIGRSLIDFCEANPKINLDIHVEDRFIDLIDEGFDVAIRITRLDDSSLVARKLMDVSSIVCASPALLERHGIPETPEELTNLPCLVDRNNRGFNNWFFTDLNGHEYSIPIHGPIEVNSPFLTRTAAVTGLGLARMPDFVAEEEIKRGNLQEVLADYRLGGIGIYVVYPDRRYLPTRVRLFLDFMAKWFRDYKNAKDDEVIES